MLDIVRCRIPLIGIEKIDYRYAHWLYGALCRIEPAFHTDDQISIGPIEQAVAHEDGLELDHHSCFRLQMPLEKIGLAYRIAGKSAVLGDGKYRFGIPRPESLESSGALSSRFVTVKGKLAAEQVEEHVRAVLHQLNRSEPGTESEDAMKLLKVEMLRRRVIQVHQHRLVGFGVRLQNLSERMSLLVQSKPVWGRRRFGAGFFVPLKERV